MANPTRDTPPAQRPRPGQPSSRFPAIPGGPIPDDANAVLAMLKRLPKTVPVDMSHAPSAGKTFNSQIGKRQQELLEKAASLGMNTTYGSSTGWEMKPAPATPPAPTNQTPPNPMDELLRDAASKPQNQTTLMPLPAGPAKEGFAEAVEMRKLGPGTDAESARRMFPEQFSDPQSERRATGLDGWNTPRTIIGRGLPPAETISSKPSWEAVGMTQKEWEDAGRPSKGDKIKPYSQRAKADIFKLNEKLNDALRYSGGRTDTTSVKLIQNQIAERNDITKALSSGLTMQEAEEYAARRQKEYTKPTFGAAVSERDDLQARANNGDKRAQMEVLKQQPANNFTGKSPYARTTPEEAWALEKAAASGDKKAKAEISTRLQTKDETGNHTLGMTRPALDRLHGKTDSPAIREAAEFEKSGAMARTNQGGGAGWSGGSSGGSSGGAMAKPNSAAAMKFDPQSKPAATRQGLDALSPAEQSRLANENPQEYDRLKKETVAKRYADTNPRETAQQKRETAQQKKPTERKAPSQPAANQTPTLTPVGQGGGAVWSGGSKGGAMASKPQSTQPTPEQRAEQTRAIQDTQARNQLSAAKQALARNPNNLKTQADANKQIAESQRILMNNALARQQAGGANKPPAKSGGSSGGGGRSGAAPKLTAKERNAAASAAASKLARREDSRGIADSAYRDANADSARWGENEAQREKRLTDKGMNPAYHDWKENDQSRGAVAKATQSQWTNFNNTQKGIADQEKRKKAADAHKKAIKDGGFTDENGVWQSSKNPDGSITDALMNNIQNLTSSAGSSGGGSGGGNGGSSEGALIGWLKKRKLGLV